MRLIGDIISLSLTRGSGFSMVRTSLVVIHNQKGKPCLLCYNSLQNSSTSQEIRRASCIDIVILLSAPSVLVLLILITSSDFLFSSCSFWDCFQSGSSFLTHLSVESFPQGRRDCLGHLVGTRIWNFLSTIWANFPLNCSKNKLTNRMICNIIPECGLVCVTINKTMAVSTV